jgi:hypothetical protein
MPAVAAPDVSGWPALGSAVPGARFVVGVKAPGRRSNYSELPDEYVYGIGTVGGVAGRREMPYAITAGHVVTDVYGPMPSFPPPGVELMIGFRGVEVRPWVTGPPFTIRPATPHRDDGATVDAVAIPIPPEFVPRRLPELLVPDVLELDSFRGDEAYVLVERLGAQRKLWGRVADVLPTRRQVVDDVPVVVPQTVMLRFHAETTIPGDSGAPILASRDGAAYLLGFHFYEIPEGPSFDVDTVSESTTAIAALDHLRLSLL